MEEATSRKTGDNVSCLAGLKILDLTHHIAGPYCTALLAGFGAEVLKIERPSTGDHARAVGPFPDDRPHPEKSGLFLHLNAGKRSITLNLKTATGRDILKRLAREYDVVVESFAPRVMPGLGLSYETLAGLNPRLIVTSLSNFGQDGPYRDWKAQDITEYALGGLMYVIGDPDREPLKSGGSQAQYQAGLVAAIGTMAALNCRDVSGLGQHVDISIMESVLNLVARLMTIYFYEGVNGLRNGSRYMRRSDSCHTRNHPTGIYPCKDGYIGLAAQTQAQWESLCVMMERADLLTDERFKDASSRGVHADEVDAIIADWLKDKSPGDAFELGGSCRVPFGIVNSIADLFDDAQLRERAYFQEVEHAVAGKLRYPGAPFRMAESAWRPGRAPLLGEHNEETFCQRLGYSRQDLVRLRQAGII
ncbi:MAG: CoA transferase [Chloroflexi bacterium]|nr:CoA transferase [Chloroflexota bacterium]